MGASAVLPHRYHEARIRTILVERYGRRQPEAGVPDGEVIEEQPDVRVSEAVVAPPPDDLLAHAPELAPLRYLEKIRFADPC